MAVQRKKKSVNRRNSKKKSIFDTYLQKKIGINMKKWKKGRWVSQKQALAVSYSQTREYIKSRNKRLRNKSKANSKAKSKAKKTKRSDK